MSRPRRVLLIDDDKLYSDGIRALLESHGHAVACAADGHTGVAMARTERPDLIILDMMMDSDTDGFEVSRRIKEHPELTGCPVLLITGIRRALHLPFRLEIDDEWLPVTAILEKPVTPGALLAEIDRLA